MTDEYLVSERTKRHVKALDDYIYSQIFPRHAPFCCIIRANRYISYKVNGELVETEFIYMEEDDKHD